MATIPTTRTIEYPTRDGRPMGETEVHRDDMIALIEALKRHYADNPRVCVSGNLLIFYVEGDKRRHVSPDVFVALGVERRRRDNYLIWEEGKAPDFVIELTSKSTSTEDTDKKFELYRDVLKVREYFLFDPYQEYLKPPFRGYRLIEGQYRPIEPVAGRLPSEVISLHLERDGMELRLYNPATGAWLDTDLEAYRREAEARRGAEETARRDAEARRIAEEAARREAEARRVAEDEVARLRRELEALRGGPAGPA